MDSRTFRTGSAAVLVLMTSFAHALFPSFLFPGKGGEKVKCQFAIADAVDSVYYNGIDITQHVEGDLSNWMINKHVHFETIPGAYLVISGHSNAANGFNEGFTGGLHIQCSNGISGLSEWQAVGQSHTFVEEDGKTVQPYISGGGDGWIRPWNFDPLGKTPYATRLYATRVGIADKYFAFRISTDVECRFTIADDVDSVHYNGNDITKLVKGPMGASSDWHQEKTVSFTPMAGAYLAIAGHRNSKDVETCDSGGFTINCSNGINGQSGWQGVGQSTKVGRPHVDGSGGGWSSPCSPPKQRSVHLTSDPEAPAIGMPEKFAAFRIRTDVTCNFTVDKVVDSVYYNGIEVTKLVTGDLRDWQVDKQISFRPAPGAYLVVAGHNSEPDSCRTGGFQIICSNGVNGSSGWEGVDSTEKFSQPFLSGNGAGWDLPCLSTSTFQLSENVDSRKISMNQKHFIFRLRIESVQEFAHAQPDGPDVQSPPQESASSQESDSGSSWIPGPYAFIGLGVGVLILAYMWSRRRQRKIQIASNDIWLG